MRSLSAWTASGLLAAMFAARAEAQSSCVDLDDAVFGTGATLCTDPPGGIVCSGGTVTFTLTVGSAGYANAGRVQIELPADGRGMSVPQEFNPAADGFIEAITTRPGVSVTALVPPSTTIADFQLSGGSLIAGDQIIMTYSTDMPKVGGTIYWRFRTNRDADPNFEPDNVGGCYVGPGFVLQGEAASYIQLTAPGDVVLGEPFTVAAVAFDQYANLAAPGTAGTIALRSTAPAECVSGLPETFDFAAGGGVSSAEFTVTYTGPAAAGFQRIFDADTNGPPVFTHFSRVHAVAPSIAASSATPTSTPAPATRMPGTHHTAVVITSAGTRTWTRPTTTPATSPASTSLPPPNTVGCS
jgi:hypothetical protein